MLRFGRASSRIFLTVFWKGNDALGGGTSRQGFALDRGAHITSRLSASQGSP